MKKYFYLKFSLKKYDKRQISIIINFNFIANIASYQKVEKIKNVFLLTFSPIRIELGWVKNPTARDAHRVEHQRI